MAGEPARPIPQPLPGRVFGPSAVQGSPRSLGGEPKRREQRSPSAALSACGPHRSLSPVGAVRAGTVTRNSPDAAGTSGCNWRRWQQRYGGSRAAGISTIGTTTRHGRMHSARLGFTGIDRRSLRAFLMPAGSGVANHHAHPGRYFDEHCDRGAKGQHLVAPTAASVVERTCARGPAESRRRPRAERDRWRAPGSRRAVAGAGRRAAHFGKIRLVHAAGQVARVRATRLSRAARP